MKKTESVLRRFQVANAQRKTALDSATQISIIATNPQGTITVFNKGAENMLGYKADEVIDRQNPLIFHLQSELDIRSRLISKKEFVGRPFSDLGPSGNKNFNGVMKIELAKSKDRLSACVISLKEQHFKRGKQPFYVRVTACPTHYHQHIQAELIDVAREVSAQVDRASGTNKNIYLSQA